MSVAAVFAFEDDYGPSVAPQKSDQYYGSCSTALALYYSSCSRAPTRACEQAVHDGRRQPLTDTVALRLNGMLENSDSFRSSVGLEPYGVAPTVTIAPNARTKVTLSYEYSHDERTADRGITLFRNAPAAGAPFLLYGNPPGRSRNRSRG